MLFKGRVLKPILPKGEGLAPAKWKLTSKGQCMPRRPEFNVTVCIYYGYQLEQIYPAMTGAKPACNRHCNAEAGQKNKQAGTESAESKAT